jgi:hypothetical protein
MMARNRRSNRDRQDVGPHPLIVPQAESLTAVPPAPELDLDYRAREQFLGLHARGERFACIVTHRRAGKTVACIQALQRAALSCARERPRFAYLSPFLKQSKTVAWDYLRGASAPLIEMGARVRESELRVDYPNGGQVRLYGADNPDALRGIYLDGVVLDEYADMDARVWAEIIRPALADRAGWAVFIGTPKGRNAFFSLWRRAQSEANWFSLMLKASDTALIPADELELARRDLTEEQYAQEFECSFEAAVVGAYYGKLMARAEEERRVGRVPHDPRRRCGRPGIWACAMRPRSGSRKRSAARSASSITTKVLASISAITCASFCKNRTSMPGTSCRTTRRPKSSAPERAGSRCWNSWG